MSAEDDLVALLRRCHLEPEAHAPRLVVADWLEENGTTDAEAALAGGLRLARRDSFVHADPLPHIEEEDRPAVRAHAKEWLGRLASRSWGFERGLFSFRCEASELIGRSLPRPPLPGGVAWVARLKVERIGPGMLDAVLASPWLDLFHGVLALSRKPNSDEGIAEAFASQPRLRSLTGLVLGYRPLGAVFARLCKRGPWGEVVTLGLGHADLSTHNIKALAASPLASSLRLLQADYNRIGSAGVITLCHACPDLHALAVDHNRVTDAAAGAVAGLRSLRWLNLFGNAGITLKGGPGPPRKPPHPDAELPVPAGPRRRRRAVPRPGRRPVHRADPPRRVGREEDDPDGPTDTHRRPQPARGHLDGRAASGQGAGGHPGP